ncbi:hypothetical protein D3C72_2370520 [compost metagenome]
MAASSITSAVAERGRSSKMAISPKKSPDFMMVRVFSRPSSVILEIFTRPVLMM